MEITRAVFHVGVVLALSGPISAGEMSALKAEAAAIWHPYGIEITWFNTEADCSSDPEAWLAPVDRLLRLNADGRQTGRAELGAVRFRDGVAGDTIRLLYSTVSRMTLDASFGGWSVRALPAPLRERIVGQALGRVLAHELGHVLLGEASHDHVGLMRPTFLPADLVRLTHDDLRLAKRSQERLGARLRDAGASAIP